MGNADCLQNIVKNMNVTDNNETLVIKKDFLDTMKFFKESFYQDILENITVKEIAHNKFKLTYKTYSYAYEEDTNFYVYVEDKVESIKSLYKNAEDLEEYISKKYNIEFI